MTDERPSIRVVIVDDHAMVRESMTLALAQASDIEVVGTAGSADEARAVVAETGPHIAVIDYHIPGGTGVDLAAGLQATHPELRTIILTASEGVQAAAEAVAAGCAGFVRKTADVSELAVGLRRVQAGEALFDAETLAAAVGWMRQPTAPRATLTDREIDVLRQLAAGRSTMEISEMFVLSHHTARNHVRNILTKLNARSQLEAVVLAADMGIVEVGRNE